MAVTFTLVSNTEDTVPGPTTGVHTAIGTVLFDSSYPTGGEAVDLQTDLGLSSGATVTSRSAVVVIGLSAAFNFAQYLTGTELLLLYDEAGAQVSAATDASTVTVEVCVHYTI